MSSEKFQRYLEGVSRVDMVGPMDMIIDEKPMDPIVYIDGGLRHQELGHHGFSVGDGDSSKEAPSWKLSPKKDESDLAVALEHLPQTVSHIRLFGFIGGRFDHEVINLLVCLQLCRHRKNMLIEFMDKNVRAYSSGRWDIVHQGPFSLIATEEHPISLKGDLEYELDQKILKPWSSHGLSNKAWGQFELKTEAPILFISASD